MYSPSGSEVISTPELRETIGNVLGKQQIKATMEKINDVIKAFDAEPSRIFFLLHMKEFPYLVFPILTVQVWYVILSQIVRVLRWGLCDCTVVPIEE